MTWNVEEVHNIPKQPGSDGEDRYLVRNPDDLAAVIDGATDKSGRDYNGRTGGALAADTVVEALDQVPANSDPHEVVAAVTAQLADMRQRYGIELGDPVAPSAFAAIAMPARGLVVRVGDVHCAFRSGDEWIVLLGSKKIDEIHSEIRKEIIKCYLELGYSVDQLLANDYGREAILSSLQAQGMLGNRPGLFGFGVLDGRPVPAEFIDFIPLPEEVDSIVLASDGYLSPAPTWEQAEKELIEDLNRDPLRIGRHASTKAPKQGAASFDDRTYLRLVKSDDV